MELLTIKQKLKKHRPVILGSDKFVKYAIIVPLIEKEDGLHVLFEVRSLNLRRQPGDTCFPGGKVDSQDTDEMAAGIRETMEELGLKREDIYEIYPLDYMISPFGMMVYPFAAIIREPDDHSINENEVDSLFTVPLSFFLEQEPDIHYVEFRIEPPEDFPFELIVGGEDYDWSPRKMEEYFYYYENRTIWGMTARILNHFIELIQKD
ncbi:NUDIX hydrolase [Bacillus massiliglaciei]|uniref:NUDIX hydrolase n=1 Tax=Bacillus massiliglaciei TaxID=1816693 RepID=UPI000AC6A375|nr:CoA pyrophosphatase [Bacillus massiliglaciei]